MNTYEISTACSTNAWVVVAIINGRLVLNVNLPIRWTLTIIAVVAGATGYPTILEIASKLLRAG